MIFRLFSNDGKATSRRLRAVGVSVVDLDFNEVVLPNEQVGNCWFEVPLASTTLVNGKEIGAYALVSRKHALLVEPEPELKGRYLGPTLVPPGGAPFVLEFEPSGTEPFSPGPAARVFVLQVD